MAGIQWQKVGDAFQFDCANGILIEVDRLSEHKDALSAEVTIYDKALAGEGLLTRGRFNLMAPQTRAGMAKMLSDSRNSLSQPDWLRLLERVCFVTTEEWRRGGALLDLYEVAEPEGNRWLLEPYIEDDSVAVLFAAGGSGKSQFALTMAASVHHGRAIVGTLHTPARQTLYLDWEAEPRVHRQRLYAVLAGAGMERNGQHLWYKRMVGSLYGQAAAIRRTISEHNIGFVVIDSMAPARGGEAKDSEPTVQLFEAARSFGVPVLILDHISKEAIKNGTADSPMGSIQTHNQARNTWLLESVQENEGDPEMLITLTHKKSNGGKRERRHAYKVRFDTDSYGWVQFIRYQPLDMALEPSLHSKMSIPERIMLELRGGALTRDAIGERLGLSPMNLAPRLSELRRLGKVVNIEGRWGLAG